MTSPVILHVDMDAFFAAVEVLDDPRLAGKPVLVGGNGPRGVVASCTYEARACGVRSAMAMARARSLCPGAVMIAGRYGRYEEISRQLRSLLKSITPLVEPIGLDEAFLDVTSVIALFGGIEAITTQIREGVRSELSLECSVGVGSSKLIAKLASRAAKPTADHRGPRPGLGVVVIEKEAELSFLHPLPVEALWGVGPATARRLHDLGVGSVGALAAVHHEALVRRFGRSHGTHLGQLARGIDPSPVVPDRVAKSLGHERTFARDIHDPGELRRRMAHLCDEVAHQLRSNQLAGRTVSVKVRFTDFSVVTRAHTTAWDLDAAPALRAVCDVLTETLDVAPGVRLIGVSVSGLRPAGSPRQLMFDLDDSSDTPHRTAPRESSTALGGSSTQDTRTTTVAALRLQEHWRDVAAAVGDVRDRFGRSAIGPVAEVAADPGLGGGRGVAPWGPSADDPERVKSSSRTRIRTALNLNAFG